MGTIGKQVYSAPELKEIYTDPQLTKHGSVAQLTGSILPIQPTSNNAIAPHSAPVIPGSQQPADGQQRPANDDVVLQQRPADGGGQQKQQPADGGDSVGQQKQQPADGGDGGGQAKLPTDGDGQ